MLDSLITPLTLTILAIFALFSIPLVLLDRKRSHYHTKFMQGVQTYLRSNVTTATSIVLHLTDDSRKLSAFIEHLEKFDTGRLQLVIPYTPKQRAEARSLQRKYSDKLKISLAQNRDEKTLRRALKRQIHGDYVCEATHDMRFDSKFFDYLSLEFLNPDTEALAIDTYSPLDSRLASAAAVWTNVLRSVIRKMGYLKPTMIVYRKKVFFAKTPTMNISESRSKVLVPLDSETTKFGRVAAMIALAVLVAAAFVAYSIFPITWAYIPAAAYLGLLMVLFVNLRGLPYTAGEKTILGLVLPFWPILTLLSKAK